MTEYFKMLL